MKRIHSILTVTAAVIMLCTCTMFYLLAMPFDVIGGVFHKLFISAVSHWGRINTVAPKYND